MAAISTSVTSESLNLSPSYFLLSCELSTVIIMF
jgi:hypothetical protein